MTAQKERCRNHMARHAIPRVIDGHLIPPKSANGSFSRLRLAQRPGMCGSMSQLHARLPFPVTGDLTARREERHGTWYWYAYRSQAVTSKKSTWASPKSLLWSGCTKQPLCFQQTTQQVLNRRTGSVLLIFQQLLRAPPPSAYRPSTCS